MVAMYCCMPEYVLPYFGRVAAEKGTEPVS